MKGLTILSSTIARFRSGMQQALCVSMIVCFALVSTLSSCTDHRTAAFAYAVTPIEAWEPVDTMHFRIDSIREEGFYRFSVGVRTSASTPYPFQTLWLVVRQHWHNPERVITDTITCTITNEKGDVQAGGVTMYQFTQPWKRMQLPTGASADVSIYHIMRRELLPGIAAVGIKVVKDDITNP